MFVDASAMVAILTEESGFEALAASLDSTEGCTTSAIAIWETTVRLTSKLRYTVPEAQAAMTRFLKASQIEIIAIGAAESDLALEAFDRFGKRRHPDALNMGDCFAYACAKAAKVPLLYVGNDFAQTDVNAGFPPQ
jgi:ribonuclease VapC